MLTIEELEKIARYSYYRWNLLLTEKEAEDYSKLLIKWKKDYDNTQTFLCSAQSANKN